MTGDNKINNLLSRKSFWDKLIFCFACFLFSLVLIPIAFAWGSGKSLMKEADKLKQEGKYQEAIVKYQKIIDEHKNLADEANANKTDCELFLSIKSFVNKLKDLKSIASAGLLDSKVYVFPPPKDGKKNNRILDLEERSLIAHEELADSLDELFYHKITEKGLKFVSRGKGETKEILKELRFQTSNLVDPKSATEVGKFLGADAYIVYEVTTKLYLHYESRILFKELTKVKRAVSFKIKCIRVKTGEVVWMHFGSFSQS